MKKENEKEKETNVLLELLKKSPQAKIVVSVIFLDRSGSMTKFIVTPPTPKDIVNKHLASLKERNDGWDYFVSVITFSDHYTVDIDLCPIKDAPELNTYSPNGKTLLFSTVYHGIETLLKQFKELTPKQHSRIRVLIGILSDGLDNKSSSQKYPQQLTAITAEVIKLGWDFLTFGIGINGATLAGVMGLPTDSDHAFSFEPTKHSLCRSQEIFTGATIIGDMHFRK
jgi:hypothetical protein